MKRFLVACFLFLSVFAALPGAADAQTIRTYDATKATLTNADTAYINCTVDDDGKSIQVVVTRLTGTAAGKVLLLASNDGVNYFAPPGADTATLTNAAKNTKFWTITPLNYATYQVKVISSGTTTLSAKGVVVRRKL